MVLQLNATSKPTLFIINSNNDSDIIIKAIMTIIMAYWIVKNLVNHEIIIAIMIITMIIMIIKPVGNNTTTWYHNFIKISGIYSIRKHHHLNITLSSSSILQMFAPWKVMIILWKLSLFFCISLGHASVSNITLAPVNANRTGW